MMRAPTRWLATLAASSTLLAALPVRAAQTSQVRSQVAQQAPRAAAPTTAMPNLVGLSLETAQKQPAVVKLRLTLVPESIVSTEHRAGTIARQAVPSGQPVHAGSRITVWVAVGGVTVPLVQGQPLESARAVLQKLGFDVRVSRAPSTRVRPGVVTSQAPQAGTVRPRGSAVELEVASPMPPDPHETGRGGDDVSPGRDFAVVPDLVNMDERQALDLLRRSRLVGNVRSVRPSRAAPGTILGQDLAPGTRVRPGSEVGLVVAARAEPQPPRPQPPRAFMPNLVGQTVEAAMADATVRQLRLRVTPRDDTMADGRPGVIVRQSTQESAPVEMGSPVTVWVATGVVVPAVVGLDADAARQQLTAKGLRARPSEVVHDRDPGSVVEQTPAAGAIVPRGAVVGLAVAVREMVKVPDVGRRDRRSALSLLAANRLTGAFSSDDESTLTPGLVSGQDPGSGAEVPVGTTVRMRVASGVVVPSVTGSILSDARARVASSGLEANVTEVRTDAAPAGTVFEQRPGAEKRVARGSVVQLSLARPPFALVPDLARRSRAEAESVAKAVRLAVAFEEDPASTLPPDRVSRQDPAPGASVEVGTTVHAGVATGVLVPSVVNMPVPSARARLEAAGLRADEHGEVSDRMPESTVMQQSPESNARVARGTPVRLAIAVRGPTSEPGPTPSPTPILSPTPTLSPDPTLSPTPTHSPTPTPSPASGAWKFLGDLGIARVRDLTPLIKWVVGIGAFTVVAYRFFRANRAGVDKKPHEPPPSPPHQVMLSPHVDELTSRLEVSGRALVQFEVRIRTSVDTGEQSLSVDGSLTGEDRRLYE